MNSSLMSGVPRRETWTQRPGAISPWPLPWMTRAAEDLAALGRRDDGGLAELRLVVVARRRRRRAVAAEPAVGELRPRVRRRHRHVLRLDARRRRRAPRADETRHRVSLPEGL